MAGSKKKRDSINADLIAKGLPPLADGVPIPVELVQAQAIKNAAALERKRTEAKLKSAQVRAREAAKKPLTREQIQATLRAIVLDVAQNAQARISAARELLAMDGTAPEYQKSIIEVRLTQMQPNQEQLDKLAFDKRCNV